MTAETVPGAPDDPIRATCPHCEDGHQDPRSVPWGVRVGSERDSDGQPTHLRVEGTQGSHVAQSDADWLWNLIQLYRRAPGQAVGDICDDMNGPNGVGGPCVLGPGHPHRDGIGGEWPTDAQDDAVVRTIQQAIDVCEAEGLRPVSEVGPWTNADRTYGASVARLGSMFLGLGVSVIQDYETGHEQEVARVQPGAPASLFRAAIRAGAALAKERT